MTPIARLLLRCSLSLLLVIVAAPVFAQARAWLDRDEIAVSETATLNIETGDDGEPDYSPLQADFDISGRSSSTRRELTGGQLRARTLYAVALRPRREGDLTIPALAVGNARTQPLTLRVVPASARATTHAGDDVFLESEPDDSDPYVQQAVGWVVRLYSAAPLISGQLEQPAPAGASLQQIGEDVRYSREIAGRRYEVIERRFQLIPERSGPLTIPGASFDGRGAGGLFDELFGDRGGILQAQAPARVLQVQPAPANAPQPWLPLRDLQLRYATTPRDLRTGSASTLTIEATADGATAAQMPELQLPPIDGVQVFADPVQADEVFREGRPKVKLTRRYSLVPSRAGPVTLPGMRLDWWDVRTGAVRTAALPSMSWTAAAANGAPAITGNPLATHSADLARADTTQAQVAEDTQRVWVLATLLFAALWLFTLVWGFNQRGHLPAKADSALPPPPDAPHTPRTRAELRRALDTGDLGEVADVLCAMASPPVQALDQLAARLDDAQQRQAVEALQRARWGGGDGVAARGLLRSAFSEGPRWRPTAVAPASPLAPLYPER